jgi:protocatechuate 3,4-dioxygenase beta subunit
MQSKRRQFLRGMSWSAASLAAPGVFAQALVDTARTTEGPFYPDRMPLDTDNDLLIINDGITPAVGEITHLTGRLLAETGEPIRNAFIEIWQTDLNGSYLHTGGRNDIGFDGNFQGYGRFLTDALGRYYFRTIKPVEYTLQGMHRAPHIHFAVSKSGNRVLTTQALVKGHEANARDGIVRQLRDPAVLESVMVDYQPLPGSALGELTANFDMVLGYTAEEIDDGGVGRLAPPEQRGGFRGFGGRGFGRGGGSGGPGGASSP